MMPMKDGTGSGKRESTAHVNGISIFFEESGRAAYPAVLLIMGNSAPGAVWPDAFCERLASANFRVIGFDQQDTGLSTYVDYARWPYTLDDLVDDALCLLDSLNIEAAHIAGLSQGGVLAYRLALVHPHRVRSIAVLMSSVDLRPKNDAFSGAPPRNDELPRPAPDYVEKVIALNARPVSTADALARRFVDNFRLAKGDVSPFDEQSWRTLGNIVASRVALRGDGLTPTLANNSNHALAQRATPTVGENELASLVVPVSIIHGGEDPVFPVEHAQWAARVPGALLTVIDAMGHALDPAFFEPVARTLTDFLQQ